MEAVSPVMPGFEVDSAGIEIVLGKDQPQYLPLLAVYLNHPCVPMLTRWRFSDAERAQIAAGADLVLTQLTFGEPFRPVHLQVSMPDEHPILFGE